MSYSGKSLKRRRLRVVNQQDKYRRFFAMMEMFDQTIPGCTPLSKMGLRSYWERLKHYNIDRLEEAGRICLDVCTFRPSIPKIIENIPLPVYKSPFRIEVSPEEKKKGDIRHKWWGRFLAHMAKTRKYETDVDKLKRRRLQYLIDNKAPDWLIEESRI